LIAIGGPGIAVWDDAKATAVASNTAGAFGLTGPAVANGIVTTPERFLFLLGSSLTAITGAGVNTAARSVLWCSQESITDWTPSATNTAGEQELATRGTLLAGRRGRGETLIWSTADLWRATFIGGTLVYGFAQSGRSRAGSSPRNAVADDRRRGYWMGDGKFFRYDGAVVSIPCDVEDYVFGSFNQTYAYKVWCLANPQFNEVTWFYPSANATEIDSYVTYDYDQNHWTFGALVRTTGVTRHYGAARTGPVMFDASHIMYDHEIGDVRTQDSLGAHLTYAESGPIELENGDKVMRVQRIVPDDKTAGDVSASLYTSMYPDGAETTNGPYTLASPTSVRLTARRVRLKITEAVSAAWRVGTVRLGVIPGGRR
jgi:hypothetical protein